MKTKLIPHPTYTSKTVMKVFDQKKGTFDMQVQRGIARPTVMSRKQGKASLWTPPSVVAYAITLELGQIGMALPAAAEIAEGIMSLEGFLQIIAEIEGDGYQPPKIAINMRTHAWKKADDFDIGEDFWIVFDLAPITERTMNKLKEVIENE